MRQLLHSKLAGILSFIVGAFCYSLANVFVKILSQSLSVSEILFLRYLGSLIIFLILSQFIHFSWKSKNYKLLILNGILAVFVTFLFWLSLKLGTPLSNTTVLAFTFPVFGALYAHWIFKEKLTLIQIITVLFSFLGVYLVINPTFSTITIGEICALSFGIVMGLILNILRILGKTNKVFTIFIYVQIVGVICLFYPTISNFQSLMINEIFFISIMTVLLIIGYLAMIFGYKHCSVSEGGTLQELEIIFATYWGIFIFHEKMTLHFIIGSVIIITCGIFLTQSLRYH